jgi:ATP-dependent RNA helicase SUPV3L1/SUV3
LPALLKPAAARLAALLRFHAADSAKGGLAPLLPVAGATSIPVRPGHAPEDHTAAGYRLAGPRAIRFDALESFAEALSAARAAQGPQFALPEGLSSLIGCKGAELEPVLRALGLSKAKAGDAGAPDLWRLPAPAKRAAQAAPPVRMDPASPFAKLAALAAPPPPQRRGKTRPRRRKPAASVA